MKKIMGVACVGVVILVSYIANRISHYGGEWRITVSESAYLVLFVVAEILLIAVAINSIYRSNNVLVIISVICMNVLSLVHLFCNDRIILGTKKYLIMGLVFFVLSLMGVLILYKYRGCTMKKFIAVLAVGSAIIIFNTAGVYSCCYNAYANIGMEALDVETDEKRYLQAEDFIWYSTEAFLGTNVSDCTIRQLSYYSLLDDDVAKNHLHMINQASNNLRWIRIITLFENAMFLIYISIVLVGARENRESGRLKSKQNNTTENS